MDQAFNNNVYLIDLNHVKTAAEIVYDLSVILDSEDARNKRVCLKLGDIELNQSQILSIKSLVNSINSTLSYIDTNSALTEASALALGIVIAKSSSDGIVAEEPEMTYKTIEEVTQAVEENVEQIIQEEVVSEEPQETLEENEEEIQIPSTPREYEKLEDHEAEEQKNETEEQSKSYLDEIVLNVPTSEEIKEELDTIFNSEKRLEEIFEVPAVAQEKIDESYIDVLEKEYTDEDFELDSYPTKYIKQTIRSGQVINYEGNIVIIGDCHPGSEITASGDITVWGVLSGIAHAGSAGNERARIRSLKMNAIQLRIANCYARRPDSLNIIFVEKTNTFVPEEARIVNGEIVIFKIND